jgi:signal transduction histidine kinase
MMARASLKLQLVRQIVVVIAILLTSFSALTLAAIAGHLYHDARRDTRTILNNLWSQHRRAISEVIHAYNRPTDPRIWMLRYGQVVARSPNTPPLPPKAQYSGLLWQPAAYQLDVHVRRDEFVIDWPLVSDWALLQQLSLVVLVVTLLGVAASLAVARWATRRTLGPVKSMTAGVQRMLDTGQIWPIPLPNGRDEFHDLAGLLNRLLTDLEERRQRDQALLADATHHLRTPLAVIRGNLDVALGGKPGRGPLHDESVAAVYRTVDDMAHLIEDLLAMEHAANLPHTVLIPMSLDEMAYEVIDDVRALTADRHNLRLDAVCATVGTRSVTAYPAFARRAFWAVLENALHYCDPKAGHISVQIVDDPERGFRGITVGNNGAGIAAEELPKVFTRFYRGEAGRSFGQGTGLGLSLAQALMRAQGGTIGIVSKDSWTRVTLWFRLAESRLDGLYQNFPQ